MRQCHLNNIHLYYYYYYNYYYYYYYYTHVQLGVWRSAVSSPQRVPVEPGRQTLIIAFGAEKLSCHR